MVRLEQIKTLIMQSILVCSMAKAINSINWLAQLRAKQKEI